MIMRDLVLTYQDDISVVVTLILCPILSALLNSYNSFNFSFLSLFFSLSIHALIDHSTYIVILLYKGAAGSLMPNDTN